jgi:hypothetical protein
MWPSRRPVDGGVVIEKMRSGIGNFGFDAATGRYGRLEAFLARNMSDGDLVHDVPDPADVSHDILFKPLDRDTGVDRTGGKFRVLGHETHRPDLTMRTDIDSDVDDAAQPNSDVMAETHACRLDDPSFDRMAGQMHFSSDDDVIAELEKIVIADEKRVHKDAASDTGTVQAKVGRPNRRATEQRSSQYADHANRHHVLDPLHQGPTDVGDPHLRVRRRAHPGHACRNSGQNHQTQREHDVGWDDEETEDGRADRDARRQPCVEPHPRHYHGENRHPAYNGLNDANRNDRPTNSPDTGPPPVMSVVHHGIL